MSLESDKIEEIKEYLLNIVCWYFMANYLASIFSISAHIFLFLYT